MKVCPQCERENPNAANCCMSCGAVLVREKTDKNAQVQIELNEAKNTVSSLSEALTEAQEKIKALEANTNKKESELLRKRTSDEKEKYEKIIFEQELEYSALNDRAKSATMQKKIVIGLACCFLLICVILGVMLGTVHQESEEKSNTIRTLQKKSENLGSENETNKEQVSTLITENENLKTEINTLKTQIPVNYKVISDGAECYSRCAGDYFETNCRYSNGTTIQIYTQKEGYGLAMAGWVKMSNLEEVN